MVEELKEINKKIAVLPLNGINVKMGPEKVFTFSELFLDVILPDGCEQKSFQVNV